MICIEKNRSLKSFNTLGFDQCAEHYVEASSDDQLNEIVEYAQTRSWPLFILGGGSNIVLTQDIPGLVIRMTGSRIKRRIDAKDGGELVSVAAGKNWHELVLETLDLGLQGLENLSLIPGTVGAAPVQNIGAYGLEVKDRVTRVHALHLPTGVWHDFNGDDCQFSYRHSFFKDHPGDFVITEVEFSLGAHCLPNIRYASLSDHLSGRGLTDPTAEQISQSVVAIRESKLPDPNVIGNAGSFFHNPIVPAQTADGLKSKFPGLVTFDAGPGLTKLSAGWLIDHLGYKGFYRDGVGVYKHQALVLIHKGGSSGKSLLALADEIRAKVDTTYGVKLSIEPLIV